MNVNPTLLKHLLTSSKQCFPLVFKYLRPVAYLNEQGVIPVKIQEWEKKYCKLLWKTTEEESQRMRLEDVTIS